MAGVAGFEPTNDGVRVRKKPILPLKISNFRGFLTQHPNYTQAIQGLFVFPLLKILTFAKNSDKIKIQQGQLLKRLARVS